MRYGTLFLFCLCVFVFVPWCVLEFRKRDIFFRLAGYKRTQSLFCMFFTVPLEGERGLVDDVVYKAQTAHCFVEAVFCLFVFVCVGFFVVVLCAVGSCFTSAFSVEI